MVTAQNVDLSSCDRELVQFSGAIQPHCALLVVSEPDFVVVQASSNTEGVLGKPPQALLGQPLSQVLGSEEEEELQRRLSATSLQAPIHALRISRASGKLHLFAHRAQNHLFLEFEQAVEWRATSIHDLYFELRNSFAALQETGSLEDFFGLAARQIRQFTGFDRVLAYQFLEDQSGKVVAESVRDGLESYLGLHYPASDIPEPARRLFSMLWLRHLPDVDYQPVPIVPGTLGSLGALDLSYVASRSVSVMYSQYLRNMGVNATLVLTLMKHGKLWGLISCMHHSGPRLIPYDIRVACEFLAHTVSLLMMGKEDQVNRDYSLALREQISSLVRRVNPEQPVYDCLLEPSSEGDFLFHSSGVAIVSGSEVLTNGACPSTSQILEIAAWLDARNITTEFSTSALSTLMPEATAFHPIASGLMAVLLGRSPSAYAMWFRPEVAQTVLWAGDPNKPVEVEDNEGEARLKPRTSFAIWKQEVSGKSTPWKDYELAALRELHLSFSILIARRSERLAQLNRELQRANEELEAFNYAASHDLKEPVRGIHNYAALISRTAHDGVIQDPNQSRLTTIQRLARRMDELIDALMHYSRIGREEPVTANADLNELVQHAWEATTSRLNDAVVELRIPRPLPCVECNPIQVRELFLNLLSNALKFNVSEVRTIEVGWQEGDPVLFWVRDNGIGIAVENHKEVFRIFRRLHPREEFGGGSGAGLTIVRRIVERHGGTIWIESEPGKGSTFFFQLSRSGQAASAAGGAGK